MDTLKIRHPNIPMRSTFVSSFQAGTYFLMIFDHYVCSGPALLLLAIFQSAIIGWVYGELQSHSLPRILFVQADAEVTSPPGACRFGALLWQHCRHDRVQTSRADQIQLEVRHPSDLHCKCLKCSLDGVGLRMFGDDHHCFHP